MPRGVTDPEDVNYRFNFILPSNEKYFDKISEITIARNKYFFYAKGAADKKGEDTQPNAKVQRTTTQGAPAFNRLDSGGDQGHDSKLSHREERKARSKIRKNNPNFAFLEDAILREEEKFEAQMHVDLEKCAYYPPRPALRFIPTP